MSIDAEPVEPTAIDSEPVASTPRRAAEPVATAERVAAVDVLRGFALLGILAMNVVDFGWGSSVYQNPTLGGGFAGLDRAIWIFNHFVFDTKMMTTFSMLFGAGLVLMSDRADARGRSLHVVYYRRVLWLIAIGMLHAYFLWGGDILVLYGECGLLLYPFRHRGPRTLIVLGVAATAVIVPIILGVVAALDLTRATAGRGWDRVAEGRVPSLVQGFAMAGAAAVGDGLEPGPEKQREAVAKEIQVKRGGYWGIVRERAKVLWAEHTIAFVLGLGWMAGGRMLIGMGLMKLGVFSAERSRRFYATMALLGYGIGLALVGYDTYALIETDFSLRYFMRGGVFFNYFGSILVALGHVGVLMLIVRAGALAWLTRRLAAVGRMALSNYLTHSLICTTLFYGYGFGLFGIIPRTGLAALVLAIWAFQLWLSPIWLGQFRFGPAEWVWRSLTYWRLQPMLRRAEPALH